MGKTNSTEVDKGRVIERIKKISPKSWGKYAAEGCDENFGSWYAYLSLGGSNETKVVIYKLDSWVVTISGYASGYFNYSPNNPSEAGYVRILDELSSRVKLYHDEQIAKKHEESRRENSRKLNNLF